MKKQTAATIALAATLAFSAITANAATLKDVQQQDWYYTNVTNAIERGAVNGYEDGTFRANNGVTIGEAVKLTLSYKGMTTSNGYDHWASTWVTDALSAGYIDQGDFKHYDQEFTREKVAKLIINALGEEEVAFDTSLIPDYNLIGEAYRPYVVQAYAKGIITGYEGGAFIGDKVVSRAEMVTMLERAFNAEQRVTSSSSSKKNDVIYQRHDIDVRVNGIHTAIENRYVVQYKDQVFVSAAYFADDADYNPIAIKEELSNVNWIGSGKAWEFQNAWQVSNDITTKEMYDKYTTDYYVVSTDGLVCAYSLSYLREQGIPVEYDSEERVVYLGEREIKIYQHNADKSLKSTPIVSIKEDINNCWAGCGSREELLQGANDSNFMTMKVEGPGSNRALIVNVKGCTKLRDTNSSDLYDLETGVLIYKSPNDMRVYEDIDVATCDYVVAVGNHSNQWIIGVDVTSVQ